MIFKPALIEENEQLRATVEFQTAVIEVGEGSIAELKRRIGAYKGHATRRRNARRSKTDQLKLRLEA